MKNHNIATCTHIGLYTYIFIVIIYRRTHTQQCYRPTVNTQSHRLGSISSRHSPLLMVSLNFKIKK